MRKAAGVLEIRSSFGIHGGFVPGPSLGYQNPRVLKSLI